MILLAPTPGFATTSRVRLFSLPTEVRSTHYRVTINGRQADVLHAASNYYLLNFETDGPVTVSVTAEDPHFWDRGVEVQPMRLGIRPVRRGGTITFPISGPEKVVIARPGDHFAEADMLFLFANAAEPEPDHSSVRYFGPGLHRENIDAHSGDRIFLDGGAVVLGAINLWRVKDVRIFGQGTVIYDGPQDPHADEGWMHKPNWHCIVMDQAENIEIDGVTCITRSRSWQVQMRDSHHIGFYNVKVVGGNPNDANQDGIDWLGGGQTTVRNSFFRASDDVFALQGNWEGYQPELLREPGHDVRDITIEDTIVSTSISNTVRVNWPEKTFNSAHFHMRDVDVLHTGFGACKVPFAFFELWADPDGHGRHQDYVFEKIRLEDWYSLLQIRQSAPLVTDVRFTGVWDMDGPAMVAPVVRGDVHQVVLAGATIQGFAPAAIERETQAEAPEVRPGPLSAAFTYPAGRLEAGKAVSFTAEQPDQPRAEFEWLFGDGTRGSGPRVQHRFADAEGTLLDGSGRFRVLLHVRDDRDHEAWQSESVVLAHGGHRDAEHRGDGPRPPTERSADFAVPIETTGGYTFTLLTSTVGSLAVDDLPAVTTPTARAQVCGAPGNAVQAVRQSAVLEKGIHHVRITRDKTLENAQARSQNDAPVVLWEGPGVSRRPLQAP